MTIDTTASDLVVGVVGAGTMGRGIAQVAVEGGVTVLLFDGKAGAAEAARDFIGRMLERQAEKGAITRESAREALERVRLAASIEDVAEAPIVIEAIVEDLAAKQALFRALEAAAPLESILVSNTSSLPVTAIAAACERRERVAGMHFFNPVPLMKLVEVVPGLSTSPAVIETLIGLARRMGREPVVSADSPGFIVNHVGRAYVPEAGRIVAEGIARFDEVDRIMTGAPGFRLGPFALLDLIGSDISVAVMESIWQQFFAEPMYATGPELTLRVAGGMYGSKTGLGWYAYQAGKRVESTPAPTPPVAIAGRRVATVPSQAHPDWTDILAKDLVAAGAEVEITRSPAPRTLTIVTPVGWDLATTCCDLKLDAACTIAVDMLFGLTGTRTVMVSPATAPVMRDAAHALLAAGGPTVVINDSPGFVAQRIVAHIINVASQVASRRVAKPADIDMGTRLGLGYPMGPLAWGDRLGPGRVLHILERLEDFYRDPRYRPSPWLKRRAMQWLSLLAPDGRGD
jgi:3-hydroxybutyryl-CoA dehydrogenase